MTGRLTEQDLNLTSSQVNFLECAELYEQAASYHDSLLAKAEDAFEERLIKNTRDNFLFKAKEYRELAS